MCHLFVWLKTLGLLKLCWQRVLDGSEIWLMFGVRFFDLEATSLRGFHTKAHTADLRLLQLSYRFRLVHNLPLCSLAIEAVVCQRSGYTPPDWDQEQWRTASMSNLHFTFVIYSFCAPDSPRESVCVLSLQENCRCLAESQVLSYSVAWQKRKGQFHQLHQFVSCLASWW